MGYRGKLEERARARELRAKAWTLTEIAEELGVSKSSVSVWVRDVDVVPRPRTNRNYGARGPRPHAQRERKLAEIAEFDRDGRRRLALLSDREALIAGVALYAGEGGKRDGAVSMANTNADLLAFFCRWLRRFFVIEEGRLRAKIYLHEGLDIAAATAYWSEVTGIPAKQFGKPYRAVADASRRHAKHVNGCATVTYCCSRTHREIMGLVRALPAAAWSA